MSHSALYVVLANALGAVLIGWLYFRRCSMPRPPIGTVGPGDVGVLLGAVVVVPFIYLALPQWLVGAALGLTVLGMLSLALEPIVASTHLSWLLAAVLVGADIGAFVLFGSAGLPFLAINNFVIVMAVVALANLWSQGGMKARDATVLSMALAIYDFVATARTTMMDDLVNRLATVPFAPTVAWPAGGEGLGLGIGLGDLLVATTFPLVVRKAFGRRAGLASVALTLAAIAGMMGLADLGILQGSFPTMVVLGPLSAIQYGYWLQRKGKERTTWQYLEAEPRGPSS